MQLISYSYKDEADDGWSFSPVTFKRVNLFVGATGSGKSRMINSLCNIADLVNGIRPMGVGFWDIKFRVAQVTYRWQFDVKKVGSDVELEMDRLTRVDDEGTEHELYRRDSEGFVFNGVKLPKLPKSSCGIYLLKDEETVAPVFGAFGQIKRRSFFANDLQQACSIGNLPNELLTQAKTKKASNIAEVIWALPLGVRIFLLKEYDSGKYRDLIEQYKAVFPTVENIDFTNGADLIGQPVQGKVPVLTVKERLVGHPVMLHHLSSGMQKVLFILSDVIMLTPESVYIIDEYENSLGVNAVNFLPGLLNDYGSESQFIVTSHHPYLINKMPVSSWQVFYRSGSKVLVESGEHLKEKYGASKQEAFIQLLNDPIFTGAAA